MHRLVIDCLGEKCPRPIVELAKAARRFEAGSSILIRADDLAFESDLVAWCEATGARLIQLDLDGYEVTAVVELARPCVAGTR